MFVSAWIDDYLTYGNDTTNRVESQHASLKRLLNSAQNKLDQIVKKIEDIVKLQNTAIKEKLEICKTRQVHKMNYRKIRQFKFLIGNVSIDALEKIYAELQRLNDIEDLSVDNCGCQLRRSHGLPCAHELAFYGNANIPIPLDALDVFWRTLTLDTPITTEADEVKCDAEVETFKTTFAKQPTREKKLGMLQKLKSIFDSAPVGEPSIQKSTRGRPTLKSNKSKQGIPPQAPIPQESRRHSCSTYRPMPFELNEQQISRKGKQVQKEHDVPPVEARRRSCSTYTPDPFDLNKQRTMYEVQNPFDLNEQPTMYGVQNPFDFHEQPTRYEVPNQSDGQDPFWNILINDYQPPQHGNSYTHHDLCEIPSFFQPYVTGIEDVVGDGNCGFRSIAVALGRPQDEWKTIRRELLEELHSNPDGYQVCIDDSYAVVERSLDYYRNGFAPIQHWMKMPDTGVLIANTYNCIVCFLTNPISYTFFPLWKKPRAPELNQTIAIAFVHGNHFIKLDLQEGHPMPRLAGHCRPAKEWKKMYKDRLLP